MPLLELRRLSVHFPDKTVVHELSLQLERGMTIGIIGESGSGKSLSGLACIGLLPPTARVSGSIRFDGEEVIGMSPTQLCQLRGRRIAMVFQDTGTALTPWLSIGTQLGEPLREHLGLGRREARRRAVALLEEVQLPMPQRALSRYPHEFSGGQRQRILLAIALAAQPELLIADEPTTALDVTVQAQILELLATLQRERGLALFFISHDLAVVNQIAEHAVVMDAGRAVERGSVQALFHTPRHPSTRTLMNAIASRSTTRTAQHAEPASGSAMLRVENLAADYRQHRRRQRVLRGINLELRRSEIVALVGESGSGKSTLARVLLQLMPASAGDLRLDGAPLVAPTAAARRRQRARVQMVFQDPYASLNPRLSIAEALAEPMRFHGLADNERELAARVAALLEAVELDPAIGNRYPHAFSGGQRQRIAIARALATEPDLLVADEPVSALDVATQCAILELLATLVRDRRMAMLLISHDLEMVRTLANRTAVIYRGQLVEQAATSELFSAPRHEHTRQLLAARPSLPTAP